MRLLIALLLSTIWMSASAELTDAQKQVLHEDMVTQPALLEAYNTGNDTAIAAFYNTQASPDFYVWRSSVSKDEYQNTESADATTFSWSGTGGYIARSQGERDAWDELFTEEGFVNPSRLNVRLAFTDIFSGSGAQAQNNRNHLLRISKRKATRVEVLFATGTGSLNDPGSLVLEGPISYIDASEARVWQ